MEHTTRSMTKTAADAVAVERGCYYDHNAGMRVVEFFSRFLRHSTGQWAGQPFELLDWQREDLILPLFGWRMADGTRRFRLAYIEIPKKNGKSTLCSGLGLYLMAGDGEPGAQAFIAACDRNQASIVFREASSMVRKSPAMLSRMTITDSTKTIAYPRTGSWLRALSGDSGSNEGLNIHGLIFDELHAQRDRRLWDTLRYGGAARRQPLLVAITTAGTDRESVCWEQHEYALKLLDGSIRDDINTFAYVRAAGVDDDWTKEETWKKANPSYGETINPVAFAAECREAQESPTKENSFKRYRLNIWTQQVVRWIQQERWQACKFELDEKSLEGRPCFGGVDLSAKVDISACVWVFPPVGKDDSYVIVPRFWIPAERAVERETRDRVPYLTWVRQGWVRQTPGVGVDQDFIRADINRDRERFRVIDIAFDPWAAHQFSIALQNDGAEMVEFGQGYKSMSEPSKELERLVLAKRIQHGGNPCMDWMISNVAIQSDAAGNIKPAKDRSNERIDGVVATVMGIGRALVTSVDGTKSVYESRGFIEL